MPSGGWVGQLKQDVEHHSNCITEFTGWKLELSEITCPLINVKLTQSELIAQTYTLPHIRPL